MISAKRYMRCRFAAEVTAICRRSLLLQCSRLSVELQDDNLRRQCRWLHIQQFRGVPKAEDLKILPPVLFQRGGDTVAFPANLEESG